IRYIYYFCWYIKQALPRNSPILKVSQALDPKPITVVLPSCNYTPNRNLRNPPSQSLRRD
ncbi:MAG: hypothetical protein WBZ19_03965, partial [Chthoniobacterales bacterium]